MLERRRTSTMIMKAKPGIYCIKNTLNGKVYVGSSVCVLTRTDKHKKLLNETIHYNQHLQNAYNKNAESFMFYPLEYISDNEKLLEREQYWIDFYKSYDRSSGYNLCRYAYSTLGNKHTEETKKKCSNANKGRIHTIEARINMSNAHKGKSPTEATRKKLSDVAKGRVHSSIAIERMSKSQKGRICSVETREKISKTQKGKLIPIEKRERMSNAKRKIKIDQYPEIARLVEENGRSEIKILAVHYNVHGATIRYILRKYNSK